jgi:hypothetical protein
MNSDGTAPASAARKLVEESSEPHIPADGQISEADAARAAENIRVWRTYLPQDCVDTMIEMGWHLSV